MPAPNPSDLGGARDLRVITPGAAYLDPLPRALFVAGAGVLRMEAPGLLPDVSVAAGETILGRPSRILAGTTATIVALY